MQTYFLDLKTIPRDFGVYHFEFFYSLMFQFTTYIERRGLKNDIIKIDIFDDFPNTFRIILKFNFSKIGI